MKVSAIWVEIKSTHTEACLGSEDSGKEAGGNVGCSYVWGGYEERKGGADFVLHSSLSFFISFFPTKSMFYCPSSIPEQLLSIP